MKSITSMSVVFILLALQVSACQTRFRPISSRDIGGIRKAGTPITKKNSRPIGENAQTDPEVFLRNKRVIIEKKPHRNQTGSLFNLSDERNYLFGFQGPQNIGKYLNVKVSSNSIAKNGAATGEEGNKKASEKGLGAAEAAILEGLPNLAPAEEGAKLISQLKMRVAQVYENGDVLGVVKRTSIRGGQGHEIVARARIPQKILGEGQTITTNDLHDVHWLESTKGELIERYSHSWEDEFTARISGFEEAKSKQAVDLDKKREKLQEAKSKVEQQLVSIGKERQTVAKERDEAKKMKVESAQKVETLESELKEKADKIEEQQKELESLKNQIEKPGDTKDVTQGA